MEEGITLTEAAQEYGIPRYYLHIAVRLGVLQTVNSRGTWARVRRADVAALMSRISKRTRKSDSVGDVKHEGDHPVTE